MAISPTVEGFRAAFRKQSICLTPGGDRVALDSRHHSHGTLFSSASLRCLNTLPVTNGELLFLRSRQPYLVSQALAHILRGSLSRAVMSTLVAVLMLTLHSG